jgi:hypothetical protein
MVERTVEGYIAGLPDWQAEIVTAVRKLILDAAPDAKESIKWAQPVYENVGPFAYIKAFKNAVNFGFWRGADLQDPKGLLQGSGEKMRHIKLTNPDQVQPQEFENLIKQALSLNLEKGDPTKGN